MKISLPNAACLLFMLSLCSAAQAEFTPITGWEKQLFPSYIIATASLRASAEANSQQLGDPLGLLGVVVDASEANTPVKVTIECAEFMETSVYSGTLAKSKDSYRIFPKIKFRYDRLANCNQATPISVTYRVQLGNQPEEEQTVTFTIRSVNDCPFLVTSGKESIDTSFTFAAYVNEQHPFVDKLLREALDRGVVDNFSGYQDKDPKEVLRQAYALWDLLVSRDMRYSSITASAADSQSVSSQHVRLIEESINNSQANCVDGSVLWVSMMRKIGIDAFLVIEPTHCYAGFYADAKKSHVYAIETTLVGVNVNSNNVTIPKELDAAVEEDLRDDDSFASFAAALHAGRKKFTKGIKASPNGNSDEFHIIDIAEARKQGVLPIAFQHKEDFLAFDHSAATEADESEEEDESDE